MEKCQYQEIKLNESDNDEDNFSWRYFSRQLLVCSSMWISFLVSGLSQGSIPVVIPQLRREANSTDAVTEEMASWISSASSYSGTVWVLFMPIVSHYVGRKYTFLGSSFIALISYISFYLNTSVVHLLCTYMVQGLLLANNLTIYIVMLTEYSSPKYRAVFLPFRTASLVWGMWIANAIGTFFHWKTIGILAIVLCSYICIASFFWVESPYWLASKGRFDECAKCHRWLRGTNKKSERELRELINFQKELDRDTGDNHSRDMFLNILWKGVLEKSFYKSFLLSMLVLALYNFSGKMVFALYAIDIIKKITANESKAYIGMLILDGITVMGMYLGCILSRWIKRRTILLTNSLICVMFLFVTSLYLYLIRLSIFEENYLITLVFLIGFTLSVSCGPFLLAACIYGEMTPLKSRTLFFVLIGIYFNLLFATTVKVSPMLFRILNLYGAFGFYGAVTLVLICLTYKYLPETKDKTIVEIRNIIVGKKNLIEPEKDLTKKLVQEEQ